MTYIYESPDNGNTVYKRKVGETNRVLHRHNKELQQQQDRWIMWQDILKASHNNLALKEALERAQVIYELSRCDNH
jgi:RNA polymerase-interacting CarD/CdnL/TRCF family regulator